MAMGHNEHDHPPHTDEEHMAQHRKAARHFARALRRCVEEQLCSAVILQEAIDIMVQGAVTQAIPMSELVSDVVETYNNTVRSLSASKSATFVVPPAAPGEDN